MNSTAFFASVCTIMLGCSDTTGDVAPGALQAGGSTAGARGVIGFDDVAAGALPSGWLVEGTHQEGPLATWQVVADGSAPSAPNALALTATNHDSGDAFNVFWTDDLHFQDGTINLSFKALSGEEDQGGGPMWRVQDANNYYVCRMNPLEDNFRLYVVKDGVRSQLESAAATVESGTWHRIKAEQYGARILCWLDGILLLEAQDASIPGSGGVGLWTKADACTSFDDISVFRVPTESDSKGTDDR